MHNNRKTQSNFTYLFQNPHVVFVFIKPWSQPAVLASACCLLAKTWAKLGDPYVVSTASVRFWEHADTT